jgi:hypothetical protein
VKPPTKADIRRELEAQVEAYLRGGGTVRQVERGVSGRDSAEGPLKSPPLAEGELPRASERTYVPEVVAAIEQRKQGMHKSRQGAAGRRKKPRKVIIYDDFGEPLRWQWEE